MRGLDFPRISLNIQHFRPPFQSVASHYTAVINNGLTLRDNPEITSGEIRLPRECHTHMSPPARRRLSGASRSRWWPRTRSSQRRRPWRGWWWGCRWSGRWPCRACCRRWWRGRCPWTRLRRGSRESPRPRRRSWPCRPRSCSGWGVGWW